MSKKALSIFGVALAGLGSTFIASPAEAAIADCGTAPSGGTLTWVSNPGICELSFDAPGTYSWTPTDISDLQALIVGGGGSGYKEIGLNSDGSNAWNIGYAGSGGEVRYLDLSQVASATPMTITIGAGGQSSPTPSAGTATTVDFGLAAPLAAGGVPGSWNNYCVIGDGNGPVYIGFGDGAGGLRSGLHDYPCVTPGAGIDLSVGTHDIDGNAVPALFASYQGTFGLGGNVTFDSAVDLAAVGQGANFAIDTHTLETTGQTDGGNGIAVFRWTPSTITTPNTDGGTTGGGTDNGGGTSNGGQVESLASTGSNDAQLAWFATGALALGLALINFMPRGRRRSKTAPKH